MPTTIRCDVGAYDCVLRGREVLLGPHKSCETFEEAKKCFLKALKADPNYAKAYAALGLAHVFDYQNRWSDNPDQSLETAKENAERRDREGRQGAVGPPA